MLTLLRLHLVWAPAGHGLMPIELTVLLAGLPLQWHERPPLSQSQSRSQNLLRLQNRSRLQKPKKRTRRHQLTAPTNQLHQPQAGARGAVMSLRHQAAPAAVVARV
jgi:hypothetical protein